MFHGRFNEYDGYDESEFAKIAMKNGTDRSKLLTLPPMILSNI